MKTTDLMKVAVLESPNTLFRIASVARPKAERGQILVRIKASGVNPLDTKIHAGQAAHARHSLPAVLGIGDAGVAVRRAAGGLAPWQERRAKEMMNAYLDVSLPELAQECRLSVTHFVRAFRRTTGMSPHQWLLAHRIDKATSLLIGSSLTLTEIALACGFSSQSHLNTAFIARVGTSPGQLRRSLLNDRTS